MFKRTIASLALICASATSAEELPEWLYINTSDNGTVVYARSADLVNGRSNQTAAPVWIRFDSSRDKTISFKEARVLYAINCVARTSTHVQGTMFYRDGRNVTNGVGDIEFIIPGSNMDHVADLLCSDPEPQPDYR